MIKRMTNSKGKRTFLFFVEVMAFILSGFYILDHPVHATIFFVGGMIIALILGEGLVKFGRGGE